MTVTVPATSANLGPGFDTLGLAVDFVNKVVIKPSKFQSISLKGEGSNNPKLKDNNLFINIFNDFFINLIPEHTPFRFEFYNKIPISRGLGSSSAVIISAIASAYAMADIDLPKERLLNLALNYEDHPDNITPAVFGGFTVATVNDNSVQYLQKKIPNSLKAVVVIPNQPISTSLSRTVLPEEYNKKDAIFNVSHSSLLTACFFNEDWEKLAIASKDRFHQEYRMKTMPELFEVQKVALKSGALMSTLSGSGSSFFNIVHQDDAKRLHDILGSHFPHYRTIIVDFNNSGVVIDKS
jgi:homoserine kinase